MILSSLTNDFREHPLWANATVSGSDIILRAGDEVSLTLKNAVGKKFKMIDADGTNLFVSADGVTISNDLNRDWEFTPYLENAVTENIVVNSGTGNDTITLPNVANGTIMSSGGNNRINFSAGSSDNYKSGYGNNAKVQTGAGNDEILIGTTGYVTVIGGAGNDTITIRNYYYGDQTQAKKTYNIVDAGAGDDIFTDGRSYDDGGYFYVSNTITGGDGNDSITVSGYNSMIDGGNGNDLIKNYGANSTTDGGNGNDTIEGRGLIVGGAGNDLISIGSWGANYSTINAGKGDDTIKISSDGEYFNRVVLEYAAGDGNDVIEHFSGGIIHLTSGSVSSAGLNGSDVMLKIGTGSIRIKDYSSYSSPIVVKDAQNKFSAWYCTGEPSSLIKIGAESYVINDGEYDRAFFNSLSDTILTFDDTGQYRDVFNFGSNVEINRTGDAHSENIVNYGDSTTLNVSGGYGNIENLFNTDVVLNITDYSGEIYNSGSNVTINGGGWYLTNTGNNVLINVRVYDECGGGNYGSNVTINAGADNDWINLYGSNQVINYSGGNDTVYGITSSDKIKIDGAYSTVANGDNVIVNVGSGSLTLLNAKDVALDISAPSDIEESDSLSSGIIYDPKKPSTILVTNPFSGMVDAANYSDKVTMIDASADSNPVTLKSGDKSTVLKAGNGGSVLIGGKAADKFYGGNGVDVFTYTVGSSGADNFYDVGKEDIVSISGSTLDKLHFVDKKDSVTITFDGDAKSKLTVSKVKSEDPLTLNVGGETFVYGALPSGVTYDKNDAKTALIVGSTAADGVTVNAAEIVSTAKTLNGSAASGAVYLIGNDNANVITAGSGGSTLYGGHSTKAVADKLIGGSGKDVFVYAKGDGADVINGYNAADGDIISIVGDASIDKSSFKESGKNVALTVGSQKLTINDVQYKPIVVVNGNDTVIFNETVAGLDYNEKRTALLISDPFVGTIAADDYASSIVTLDATNNTGEITLIGNKKAKVLVGGAGSTTMHGSTAADVFYGGSGSDTFVYSVSGGKDQIVGFDSAKDKIKIVGTSTLTAANIAEKGSDVILTVGKGSITLKNPSRGTLTIEQDDDKTISYTPLATGLTYDNKKIKLTADKKFSGVIEGYASTVEEISAASATDTVSIVGNDKNNVLRASKGGSTLDGGKGNDTLVGGAGADLFVYNSGNDLITGYSAAQGDVIDLQAAVTGSSVAKSDVVLKFGDDALTIKGGLNNAIDMIDVNGNQSTYLFTGSAIYKMTALDSDLTEASGGGAELLTEDYWFEPSSFESDPLEGLLTSKEVSLDLSTEFKDAFKQPNVELASATKHRDQK